jgi:RimJ/RimL family protein N-acetyltransferase
LKKAALSKRVVIGQPVVDWVASRTNEYGNFGCAVGFGVESNGALVGGVAFNEYNGASMCIHVAAESKHWLTRKFLWMIFDYAFNQCKVKTLLGFIGSGNKHAIAFDEGIGFKYVTRIPEAHPSGDTLIYEMRRDDCRWLRKSYAEN